MVLQGVSAVSRLDDLLARVGIVLAGPKYPENIGSAARAAHTMGVSELVVVGQALKDLEPALKTATHHAGHLVQGIRWCATLEEALADYALVVGTTARQGRQRLVTAVPSQVAELTLPALDQGRVALLFGPEDKGLSNRDLSYCGVVATIPTSARFTSLNLAQAVAISCYELRQGLERLAGEGRPEIYRPRNASREELAALHEAALLASEALDRASGQALTASRLRHLRQTVSRCGLTARGAKLFKDACHQLVKVVGRQGMIE